MKTTITFFIFSLFSIFCFSQKVVETNKVWSYYDGSGGGWAPEPFLNDYTTVYSLAEAELIDGIAYHRIRYNEHDYLNYNDSGWETQDAFLREDSLGRVYFRTLDTTDILILDFSLAIGDAFEGAGTLITKDSIELYNGSLRERFIFDAGPDWIKGIGSIGGFITHAEEEIIICHSQNDELIHISSNIFVEVNPNAVDYCYIIPVSTTALYEDKLEIFPNPVEGLLTITATSSPINENIEIYNVMGNRVYSLNVEGELSKTIDINHLSPGMYFLRSNNFTKKIIKK